MADSYHGVSLMAHCLIPKTVCAWRQAMVDFYQNYRQGVFTTGKYDEAGAVLPKAPPLHLLHYRYQMVNHYAPVTADQVRTPHDLGKGGQCCMANVGPCRGDASKSRV